MERRITIAGQKPESVLGTHKSQCTTSHTPSMSFPRNGKPRSDGSADDDGEGGGAGSTSIGSSSSEQEDAAY